MFYTKRTANMMNTGNQETKASADKQIQPEQEDRATMSSTSFVGLKPNDVLLGRGSGTNHKTGNIRFRQIVWETYLDCVSSDVRPAGELPAAIKNRVAKDVLQTIKASEGRFLRKISDPSGQGSLVQGDHPRVYYKEISDKEALEKIKQTLRFQIEDRIEGRPRRRSSSMVEGPIPSLQPAVHFPHNPSLRDAATAAAMFPVAASPPAPTRKRTADQVHLIDDHLLRLISRRRLSDLFQGDGSFLCKAKNEENHTTEKCLKRDLLKPSNNTRTSGLIPSRAMAAAWDNGSHVPNSSMVCGSSLLPPTTKPSNDPVRGSPHLLHPSMALRYLASAAAPNLPNLIPAAGLPWGTTTKDGGKESAPHLSPALPQDCGSSSGAALPEQSSLNDISGLLLLSQLSSKGGIAAALGTTGTSSATPKASAPTAMSTDTTCQLELEACIHRERLQLALDRIRTKRLITELLEQHHQQQQRRSV